MELRLDKFKLIAGDPSLEFVNTISGYIRAFDADGRFTYSVSGDKITEYIDLASWAAKAGVIDEVRVKRLLSLSDERPNEAAKAVAKAVRFRNVLYRLFKASIEGWEPAERDLAAFNTELAEARRRETLVASGKGLAFEWSEPDSLDLPLRIVAKRAAELFTSDSIERLRECRGEHCGWLFLDMSRSRNRLWCDMRDCGNLAKVRKFRSARKNLPA